MMSYMRKNSLSIFTSMTNPDDRNDPWKESLKCYEDLADEVIIVGDKWPNEFSWEVIGNTFQEGLDKSSSDWVIRMDIDYFFHEKDFRKIRNAIDRFKDYPALAFPQYQFFTPNRYQIKTRLCIAFNKRLYPEIKLNGGGDLTLATLNNRLINPKLVPNINTPIYQYDSLFRTKKIIAEDRARFARAWNRYFGQYNDRGGPTSEEAYQAWYNMVQDRYPKHTFKIKIEDHPKFIIENLKQLQSDQFGYDLFGLKNTTKMSFKNYLKGYREKYINPIFLYKNNYLNYYNEK